MATGATSAPYAPDAPPKLAGCAARATALWSTLLPPGERRLAARFTLWSLAKLSNCTSNRMLQPYAPTLGRLVGWSTERISQLIGYNKIIFTLTALAGPAVAARVGTERLQCWTLAFMGATMLLVGLVPHSALLGMFVAAALCQGLKGIFDAALQALVGACAPPARRGTYTGLVELAWGGSSLVGLPVAGALLAAEPRAMFLALGAAQLAPALALLLRPPLPAYEVADAPATSEPEAVLTWREAASHGAVQEIAASIAVVVACVDAATVDFGVWLQEARGLDTGRVAAATLALGFADFGGELLATLIIDRVGLLRARRGALLATAAAAAALAGAADVPGKGGLIGGLICHFAMFLAMEVVIVALLAASAVTLPAAGGRVEALTVGGIGVGHIVGAFISLPLWNGAGQRVWGYALLCVVAMVATAAASALAALRGGAAGALGGVSALGGAGSSTVELLKVDEDALVTRDSASDAVTDALDHEAAPAAAIDINVDSAT